MSEVDVTLETLELRTLADARRDVFDAVLARYGATRLRPVGSVAQRIASFPHAIERSPDTCGDAARRVG